MGVAGLKRIRASVAQKAKRDTVQRLLIFEAGGCCARCEELKHPNVYDFHHITPSTKLFNLDRSNFGRSLESLRAEAAKCALLCANCHREVHTYLDPTFLKQDPQIKALSDA